MCTNTEHWRSKRRVREIMGHCSVSIISDMHEIAITSPGQLLVRCKYYDLHTVIEAPNNSTLYQITIQQDNMHTHTRVYRPISISLSIYIYIYIYLYYIYIYICIYTYVHIYLDI